MINRLAALFLCLAFGAGALTAQADPDKNHGRGHAAMQGNNGRHLGQLRRLQFATLSDSQVSYALNHQRQNMARLRSMGRIDATRIRIVRLTAAQRTRFHVSFADTAIASTDLAQIFNTNNPLIAQLQSLVEGIIVTNAINRTLGGNTGGATASLAQVLLGSGIPLSSLLGVFFDPSGILNAIVG